ncbi:MAG: hypothetical protein HY925_10785 [Elusimicrobia bacterium]|nr:hypothetical protein [Elusimicrobiota bacterium]
MIRLRLFMLALGSMLLAAGLVWQLSPKTGHGALVDAQGRRYEVLPSNAPRSLKRQILDRYRRWRDPDASGVSPKDRLKRAYAALFLTATASAVAVALARKGRA